ncbi:MAG: hypothetical protein MUF01_01620, partial [Bryobacterales bacterium]|nr:hypothetical protein [Bryobacterales bacterium]
TLPGFYRLERAGGREDWISANVSPRESNLAAMDDAQLSIWKASGQDAPPPGPAGSTTENERRVPIGWYGFLVLAGILLAESVVANRFWRRAAEEPV